MAKDKKLKTQKSQLPQRKIHWGKIFWYTFLVIVIILFIVNNTRKDEYVPFQYPPGTKKNLYEIESNSPSLAYDFTLKSIDGKDIKLSDFRGKVVVIDFWATWCAPCREMVPDLIDIQKRYGKDVQVIGITVDQNPMKVVPSFVKEFKINYPILIGTDEVYKKFGDIEVIPTTFIIDKNGKILNKFIGLVEKEILINEITQALQT